MIRPFFVLLLLVGGAGTAVAGQAPLAATAPDIPVSARDRFYTSDQFSNTVSVIDPSANRLLGVIRLGEPTPLNLSPLYKGSFSFTAWAFRPITGTGGRLDRLQLGHVHRHRDQRDQACKLCRPLSA